MTRLVCVTSEDSLTLPVTLEEVRLHARIDHCDEDPVLDILVRAATGRVERWLGRSIVEQTWDYYLGAFPVGPIVLPRPPLLEILSFDSPAEGGDPVTDYEVDLSADPAELYMPTSGLWPTVIESANAAKIRYRAGYLQAASPTGEIPEEIRLGILRYVSDLYENRENFVLGHIVQDVPLTSKTLMHPYRVERGMA